LYPRALSVPLDKEEILSSILLIVTSIVSITEILLK
jgi:hypothetical protein